MQYEILLTARSYVTALDVESTCACYAGVVFRSVSFTDIGAVEDFVVEADDDSKIVGLCRVLHSIAAFNGVIACFKADHVLVLCRRGNTRAHDPIAQETSREL